MAFAILRRGHHPVPIAIFRLLPQPSHCLVKGGSLPAGDIRHLSLYDAYLPLQNLDCPLAVIHVPTMNLPRHNSYSGLDCVLDWWHLRTLCNMSFEFPSLGSRRTEFLA